MVSICDRAYGEMLNASYRLWDRLGTREDSDTELMIDSMLTIQRQLCREMFLLGVKYAEEIKPRR